MKSLSKVLSIILITAFSAGAFAVEDWGSIYDNYNEAEYGKPVSEQEYQNAIEVMEKFQKKSPKKGKEKLQEKAHEKGEEKLLYDLPQSQDSLFTLFSDVNYNGQVIQRGFYLINAVNRDNKHFIRLTRGEGRVIAEIEAYALEKPNLEKKVFSEIMENGILKLTYSDTNVILEAYLWIQ